MSVRSNLRKLERLSKFVQNVNTEAFKVGGVTYSLNERLGLPNMTHGKGNMYSWILNRHTHDWRGREKEVRQTRQEEGKKEGEKKRKKKIRTHCKTE